MNIDTTVRTIGCPQKPPTPLTQGSAETRIAIIPEQLEILFSILQTNNDLVSNLQDRLGPVLNQNTLFETPATTPEEMPPLPVPLAQRIKGLQLLAVQTQDRLGQIHQGLEL
jgi:hypothetical protein